MPSGIIAAVIDKIAVTVMNDRPSDGPRAWLFGIRNWHLGTQHFITTFPAEPKFITWFGIDDLDQKPRIIRGRGQQISRGTVTGDAFVRGSFVVGQWPSRAVVGPRHTTRDGVIPYIRAR